MRNSEPDSVSAPLSEHIHAAIADAGGWVSFDRFMAMALYAPGLGYYSNSLRKFGLMPASGSDFVTAPELSPLFGRAVANQVAQALQVTGTSQVFEFGAGSGALAEQMIDALDAVAPGLLQAYTIIDLSGTLRERQAARLARFGDRVRWATRWPEAMHGVVVGNEVLDAMPVQLLHFDGEQWLERGVASHHDALGAPGFVYEDRPTELRPPLEAPYVPGTVTEIHLQAEGFIRSLAAHLVQGAAFFIDYGFPEAEYYLPQRHMGTLMCHRLHMADDRPLEAVGEKDITAHINFTGIALAAQEAGMDVIGYTSQARFLVNCGVAPMVEAADLAGRAMAQKLLTEHEMGELFKVIGLAPAGALPDPIGFMAGDRTHRL
ncbi:class I SAM-dependent methyltransferase [Ideonella margarita]|uniref:SAM-dependent methyltransferase n=1 Tax=Ideonella margarita TaxID=2984191 RepID=A0ABU9C2P7_9BURK